MGRVSRFIDKVRQEANDRANQERADRVMERIQQPISPSEERSGDVPAGKGKVPITERRASVRRVCRRKALTQPRSAGRGGFVGEATLRDISRRGVGLVLEDRCPVGAILELNLRCPKVPRALLIRVLRARPYAEGFLHCCVMLNPLSGEELEELLTAEE